MHKDDVVQPLIFSISMKTLKKVLVILISIIVVLFIGGMIFIDMNLPKLPSLSNRIINKTLEKHNYSLKGEQGYAVNDDTKIWYESIQAEDTIKGHIILIMGISNNALAWPNYFIKSLTNYGYNVIRYDNRGTGMSDWVTDWSRENAYTLEDLADDAIAILDTLNIQEAHVIGVSLGGMIAQTISINHPERVTTLVSMISTGDILDPELPSINMNTVSKLVFAHIRYGLFNSEENLIKEQVVARLILQGDEDDNIDIEDIANRTLYDIRYRNGQNPKASKQHITATGLSGSRYEELNKLNVPTLVIHGNKDPLIDFSHGLKTYEAIPDAQYLWIDGMGHGIPAQYNDTIVSTIIKHINNNTVINE